MTEQRFIEANPLPEDAAYHSLRPQKLEEFAGQDQLKRNLKVILQAATLRQEPPGHILFAGPPGLGKTTLANLISNELEADLISTTGPTLERAGDLVSILTNLKANNILFIDEIHRMSRSVEETLYQAMEDFRVDIVIGKGPGARTIKLNLERFTLIGATTRSGLLTGPFRDRFPNAFQLDLYPENELVVILKRAAQLLNIKLDIEAAAILAQRGRGTPRVGLRLLRWARDFALVHKNTDRVTQELALSAMHEIGIDNKGCDVKDRKLLNALVSIFGGGPVGLDTLSAYIAVENDTVEDVVEPYLMRCGLIARTPRGRIATSETYNYLGLSAPSADKTDTLWEPK